RGTRTLDPPEIRAVSDVAIRLQELCVVQEVEKLRTELNALMLGDRSILVQRKVPVTDAGAAADSAFRIPECSRCNRIIGEQIGIEPIPPICFRILMMEWARLVWLAGQFEVKAIHFLDVVLGSNTNRESALGGDDTRHVPAICNLSS